MKQLSIFSAIALLAALFFVNTVYNYSVPKIEGGIQNLSAYQGKKVMVVTLPLTQTASADSFLYALDTIATRHAAHLKVIAVPAKEDGYTTAQKQSLQTWYRSKLNAGIVITDGLYTRKTAGAQQHPLFKWLTSVTENEHLDIDVEGPGYKFFTNRNGGLYGVLRPQSKMWGGSVQRTLNMQ
jgi:glutathione peroxidase-family protein